MKLDIGGDEKFDVPIERLWAALNDPAVLTRCIPGCREMIPNGEDAYRVILDLKVASVGGSFAGAIALTEKVEPNSCRITISGSGTLGEGTGNAIFTLAPEGDGTTLMHYGGEGEVGGLVAGVGQRILKGVAKHLVKRFFNTLKADTGGTDPCGLSFAGMRDMKKIGRVGIKALICFEVVTTLALVVGLLVVIISWKLSSPNVFVSPGTMVRLIGRGGWSGRAWLRPPIMPHAQVRMSCRDAWGSAHDSDACGPTART